MKPGQNCQNSNRKKMDFFRFIWISSKSISGQLQRWIVTVSRDVHLHKHVCKLCTEHGANNKSICVGPLSKCCSNWQRFFSSDYFGSWPPLSSFYSVTKLNMYLCTKHWIRQRGNTTGCLAQSDLKTEPSNTFKWCKLLL